MSTGSSPAWTPPSRDAPPPIATARAVRTSSTTSIALRTTRTRVAPAPPCVSAGYSHGKTPCVTPATTSTQPAVRRQPGRPRPTAAATGAASQVMYCGEPTLSSTISVRAIRRAPRTTSSAPATRSVRSRSPKRSRRHHTRPAAATTASTNSTPSTSTAVPVPAPRSSQSSSSRLSTRSTDRVTSAASSHGVAPTASSCRPLLLWSVRNDATKSPRPRSRTDATTTAVRATAGSATSRHGRRAAANSGQSTAPGATLIQAPAVSSNEATVGRSSAQSSATRVSGTTTASSRPRPTGPSSSRKPVHHQPPTRPRRRRSSTASAATSSTVAMRHQATAYPTRPPVPPAAARTIGSTDPTG